MKFLPDSAVLGTYKRIMRAGKPRRRKGVGGSSSKPVEMISQSWESYRVDTRSFEELLAEARRHAEKSGK